MKEVKKIRVNQSFWNELQAFMMENSLRAIDLNHAGLSYVMASNIMNGKQKSKSIKPEIMMLLMDIVNNPDKYRGYELSGEISSIQDMMNLNISA